MRRPRTGAAAFAPAAPLVRAPTPAPCCRRQRPPRMLCAAPASAPLPRPTAIPAPPAASQASASASAPPPAESPDEAASDDGQPARRRRTVSLETRAKIASAMVGVPKSAEMRAKLSASMKAAMKTRPPWNKGKTLSAETKARMSRARSGRAAWNKGVALSEEHRKSIAAARKKSSYAASDETRLRLRLARRRPGDAIVAGGAAGSSAGEDGFPLVDTADIHEFVSLRRQLRGWSDSFAQRAGRRPSLADVRRSAASPALVRDFERYVGMRDAIRGLAADVCGAVDPDVVPGVRPGDTTASPVNNNSDRAVLVTGNGNPRLASPAEASAVADVKKKEGKWDVYDNPPAPPARFAWTVSGTVSQQKRESDRLSMNDYRLIGKYRLMGSKDIATFVHLRRELEEWSAKFRERTGRTPKLSDVRGEGETLLYSKFARYLDMRHSMHGLMKEVYGADIDDFQTTLDKVEVQGKSVLDLLRSSGEEPAGNV